MSRYLLAPDPIAISGALAAGQSVDVTLTAKDAQGNPVPGASAVARAGWTAS